ncbi:MAG: MoaD/ThiS family protein [Anaerolineae bacterium]
MGVGARLKIYAALGEAGGKVFDIPLPRPVEVGELLKTFSRQAGFYTQLFEPSGQIKRSFVVLVNGTSIYHQQGLKTPVQDGDEVAVLSFVTGG